MNVRDYDKMICIAAIALYNYYCEKLLGFRTVKKSYDFMIKTNDLYNKYHNVDEMNNALKCGEYDL